MGACRLRRYAVTLNLTYSHIEENMSLEQMIKIKVLLEVQKILESDETQELIQSFVSDTISDVFSSIDRESLIRDNLSA